MSSVQTESAINFSKVEFQINHLLQLRLSALRQDPELLQLFSLLFDRSSEEGFYNTTKGFGETPVWSPNEAYMQSTEWLWIPVEEYLQNLGLRTDKSLRELFATSREYKDFDSDHRRIFFGQLVDCKNGHPSTAFMLTISHSHDGFRYVDVPYIQISNKLK